MLVIFVLLKLKPIRFPDIFFGFIDDIAPFARKHIRRYSAGKRRFVVYEGTVWIEIMGLSPPFHLVIPAKHNKNGVVSPLYEFEDRSCLADLETVGQVIDDPEVKFLALTLLVKYF